MVIHEGARPVTAPGWTAQPKTDLALSDCDVHQGYKKVDDLHPYLPRLYRERVMDQGLLIPGAGYFNNPKRAARTDLVGCDASMTDRDGRNRGTDYEQLREHLLDLWNVDKALLTGSGINGANVTP